MMLVQTSAHKIKYKVELDKVQERLASDVAVLAVQLEDLGQNEVGSTNWTRAEQRLDLLVSWLKARSKAGYYRPVAGMEGLHE